MLDQLVPGTGSTNRQNLEAVNPNDPRLAIPEYGPYELYIMSVFWQLCRDRPVQTSQFGQSYGSLTLASMVHYQALFKDDLNTNDILVLQTIDRAYLETIYELQKGQE